MANLKKRLQDLSPAKRELLQRTLADGGNFKEPIAVVGMACRFPGAPTLDDFWNLISEGRSARSEIPADRFPVDELYDPDVDAPGKMVSKWACLVDGLDQFDPKFFGIAPREATRMDPQQRMLLEVAWEAMEHAGIRPADLVEKPTGVFMGVAQVDYSKLIGLYDNFLELIDAHTGTGMSLSLSANRLSYVFNFKGPSEAIDTACSSALVAVNQAVQSLRSHQSDAALAGAVNVCITPDAMVSLSKARMVSPTGLCRPFHADADGYVRGEGAGVLVLKRLCDAVETGDQILAVLRDSAVNHGGRTSGITAPSGTAQAKVIRAALSGGGVSPDQIGYIEAHGTGTPLGDPIEVEALGQVFPQKSEDDNPVYLTSVKANIGHLEIAAGIAGLIKAILILQHEKIPGQPFLDKLNPHIDAEGTRITIPREPMDFARDEERGPRFIGVSSFGFGGTNAHAVIEEAPKSTTTADPSIPSGAERGYHLLTLSAKSDASLKALGKRYADYLESRPDVEIANFCHAAATTRTHHNRRIAIRARERSDLLSALERVASGKKSPDLTQGVARFQGNNKFAFLFTGQGSQYAGMGRELFDAHPVFRDTMLRCDQEILAERGESLLPILFEDPDATKLNRTEWSQPALFALEYSLARLWQSWGIEPSYLLGHSVGEYAAACLSEVFSLEDGIRLIAKRGELMQQLPAGGAMAVVFASADFVESRIGDLVERISIAAYNGPENTTVSGDLEAIEQFVERVAAEGKRAQRLTVSHAFHSHLMDPILDQFEAYAAEFDFRPPKIPILANLTGELIEDGILKPFYWREHIRNPVRFEQGVRRLREEDPGALIEVGPSTSLLGMARRCESDWKPEWVASLRNAKGDVQSLLESLSQLYVSGAEIDWSAFDEPWRFERQPLPAYPFDHQRYWFEPEDATSSKLDEMFGASAGPLLGKPIRVADATVFESRMNAESPKVLSDHIVQGSTLVPGSGYTDMAFSAARQLFGPGSHRLENLNFLQALFLGDQSKRVQTVVSGIIGDRCSFQIFSQPITADDRAPWELNATGTLVRDTQDARPERLNFDEIRERSLRSRTHDDLYSLFSKRNLAYGPTFRPVDGMEQTDSSALGPMLLHPDVSDRMQDYTIHPAIGDGAMHVVGGVVPLEADGSFSPYTYLPVSIRSIQVFEPLVPDLVAYACRTSEDDSPSPEVVTGDVLLADSEGNVLAQYSGVTIRRLSLANDEGNQADPANWLYKLGWKEAPLETLETVEEGAEQPATTSDENQARLTSLILADEQGIGEQLADSIATDCDRIVLVRPGKEFSRSSEGSRELFSVDPLNEDHFLRLKDELRLDPSTKLVVVHGWSVDVLNPVDDGRAQLDQSRRLSAASSLYLYRHLSSISFSTTPKIILVTRGGQLVDENDETAFLQQEMIGVGRVATLEYAGLNSRLVDLDPRAEIAACVDQLRIEVLDSQSDETQIAYRDGRRLGARIQPSDILKPREASDQVIPTGTPFRLTVGRDNTIDSLKYAPFRRRPPEATEVEFRVVATGLNFSDVLKSLGLYPGITDAVVPVGIESAGVVTAVGPEVTRFEVGDEVMGIVPYGFASHCITQQHALMKKPSRLDFEEAASIPIAFMTAYQCLVKVANLQPGERVLIHAGAGGVGLAAIQIAQDIGAEVFATAGSESKRDYLRSLGVEHVMSSRTMEFASQIMEATDREGVDVVLNSLPADAIDHSLSVLRDYGRFVEIGKVDIYQNKMIGLLPFQRSLSYTAVDLDRMFRQRPAEAESLLLALMERFEAGDYQSVNLTIFDGAEISEAFRFMSQRRNIGKIVVLMEQPDADHDDGALDDETTHRVRSEATYLVTGGLGALGLACATWLAENGAQSIALMSRRQPDEEVTNKLDAISERFPDLNLVVLQGDVGDAQSLSAALDKIRHDLPPIRGIIHAAGVVKNQFMIELELEAYDAVTAAKIRGGWNLHRATLQDELDFLVMFSSVSTIVGTIQQSSYGAANAFLDGLAKHRRSLGLPATTINWGPWADVGMAAESGSDLDSRGMLSLPVDESLELMGQLIDAGDTQATVMRADWTKLIRAYEALRRSGIAPPMFEEFRSSGEDDEAALEQARAFHAKLVAMNLSERESCLQEFLAEQIAAIMVLEAEDVDVTQSLTTMGLDSLMAIELANKLQLTLQVTLPMAIFIEEPSVVSLAKFSANAMEGGRETEGAGEPQDAVETEATVETEGTVESEATVEPEQPGQDPTSAPADEPGEEIPSV